MPVRISVIMVSAALLALLAATPVGGTAKAAWDGGVLKRPLTAAIAFDTASRYQEAVFNKGARLKPCTTQDDWNGRFLCNLVFLATDQDAEKTYPLWVYKHRGHVCVFDPSDEPGFGQCVPERDQPGAPRTVARFKLEGSNGYELEAERFDRTLTIRVTRGGSSASYQLLAEGPVSTNRILAHIPGLVEIAVHFRPTARTELQPKSKGCSFHVTRHTRGVFVGTIRFEGEQGYTNVDARRARGTVNHRVRSKCKGHARPSRVSLDKPPETVELGASIRTVERSIEFSCAKGPEPLLAPLDYEGKGRRFFLAELFENGKAVDIVREVELTGTPKTFVINGALTSATVAPPLPFKGVARLEQENPSSFLPISDPTWTGSLTVSFPGAADTPLVGPGFEARLRSE